MIAGNAPTRDRKLVRTVAKREVIIEQVQIGMILRVTAIDAATGLEAVFQAPRHASPLEIQRLALAKLDYIARRQQDTA